MPVPELTAHQASAVLDRHRIVDVREEYEYRGPLGFIEGAELLPLSQVADHADDLRGTRPLLLVCRSGRRSATACETLREHGIDDAINLAGGMIGWNEAGLPVMHCEPRTLAALVDQIVAWVAQVGPLTREAAYQIAHSRFSREGVSGDAPTHAAVQELIEYFGTLLESVDPPDLAISLAAFRRSLTVL